MEIQPEFISKKIFILDKNSHSGPYLLMFSMKLMRINKKIPNFSQNILIVEASPNPGMRSVQKNANSDKKQNK